MKNCKKILCLILVAALTLSIMSVGAFAASSSPAAETVSSTEPANDEAHLQGLITMGVLFNKILADAIKNAATAAHDLLNNNDSNDIGNNNGNDDGHNGNDNGNGNANNNVIGSDDGHNGNDNGNDNTVNIGSIMSIIIGNPADTLAQSNLATALAGMVKAGTLSRSTLLAMLNTLNDTSNPIATRLSNLLKLMKGSGLIGNDLFSTLLGKITGSTDISDSSTPLADAGMLNSTDHIAYVNGYPNGAFKPAGNLTRAEAAQMLYNLLTDTSRSMYSSSSNSFTDVPAGKWYNVPVSTLANAGVINGYGNGTFGPGRNITRAEFTKIIVAMYGVDSTATCSYSDVPTSSWAYQYIATAAKLGWVGGYSNGTFAPGKPITRAETVTILNRVLSRSFDTSYTGSLKTFFDVPNGQWYYNNVMEAANGHTYTRNGSSETWTGTK